jgi:hypothetical protein
MMSSARRSSEVKKAERIIQELKIAEAAGKGAASLDGKMIDAASEKMARNVIDTAMPSQPNRRCRIGRITEERRMDIHEYQSKEILAAARRAGATRGIAFTPEQAAFRCRELGGGGAWSRRKCIRAGAVRPAA